MSNIGIISPEKERELNKILSSLIYEEEDLEAVGVFTKQGVKVAYFATEDSTVDPDLMAAMSAALLATGGMAAEKMNLGELVEVTVRGKTGFMVFSNAGDFLITAAGREMTSMGLLITVLRRYAKKIALTLSQ